MAGIDQSPTGAGQDHDRSDHNHVKTAGSLFQGRLCYATASKEKLMPKKKKPDPERDEAEQKKGEDTRTPGSDRSSWDKVDEAEEESFPASDPPAY